MLTRRSFLKALLGLAAVAKMPAIPATPVTFLWSGAITPTSAVVNAKLNRDSDHVRLCVSQQTSFSQPLYSAYAAASLAANNRVLRLPISDLQPATHYYYAIEVDGALDMSLVGTFGSPAVGAHSFTVAFAACAETGSNHAVFDTIRAHSPLFFLHMGDFHYLDIDTNERSRYRAG